MYHDHLCCSIFNVKKKPALFQGKVCGLCGNYDGNIKNDLMCRNKDIVAEAFQFGNSWKQLPTCEDVKPNQHPCQLYSNRHAWAKKHCNIINSDVFKDCHSKVRSP